MGHHDPEPEQRDEGSELVALSASPAFVNYCDQWLEIGKLDEKFQEVDVIVEGNKDDIAPEEAATGSETAAEATTKVRIIKIDYFELLFKSVFFWKKMRFEDIK